jgi:N-acetylated-alpha-linked acidic dipeptidase
MRRMTEEPHVAGSPASKRVAEYALGLFREWGLDARIEEFEALLPYPTSRTLEMTAPTKYKAKLEEPRIPGDHASESKAQIPTFNAYAATGDVTAPLVYVNYGVPDDYAELKKLGIDVKGKIVIARYGQSWRGTKAKMAHENGAVACIIYSDPKDDGYFQGDVYPKGAYRPLQGVQRGSVLDMPLHTGDPLSPGWASENGSKRLRREKAEAIMKIPACRAGRTGRAGRLARRFAVHLSHRAGSRYRSSESRLRLDHQADAQRDGHDPGNRVAGPVDHVWQSPRCLE